jgi:hypothetical protein
MEHRLPLYDGHSFLGGRGVAFRVRTKAEALLRDDLSCIVVLDCAGVAGVSHSFADELLSPLSDLLGDQVARRVRVSNCTSSLYADLVSVAEMHRLHMPAVGEGCVAREYA